MSQGAPHPRMHGLTHVPGGPDPIPGLVPPPTGGPGLEDILTAESIVGLWKLDEASGTTAADSSGNGNDLTVPVGGYLPPTWAQAAGPPGTQTALFANWTGATTEGTRLNRAIGALTNDFSAGVWVNWSSLALSKIAMIGQGSWNTTNSWSIWWAGGAEKANVSMGTTNIASNNAQVVDTWYLFGFTRESGTTTLYVDGLAQSATTGTSPGVSSTNTYLGDDGIGTGTNWGTDGLLSWAFITDQPISGADWLEIYEAGTIGGALEAGLVWTSDGAGSASWEPPTIEVDY